MITNNVFYRFANLSKDKPTNKTHKYIIVKNTPLVSNELTNSLKISKIPNYTSFFRIYLEHFKMDQDTLILGKKANEIVLRISGDGSQLIYLKNYLKALSSPRIYISSLINFYKTYLKSIDLLVGRQIVHNCIQFDTLMVTASKKMPLITDFSVSLDIVRATSLDYIRPFFIQYDPEYIARPLELHILSFLLTNKLQSLSLTNIQTIIRDVTNGNSILQTFGKTIVSDYEAEAIAFFSKYVNKPFGYIVADIFYYYETWDNYALSIVFLRILIGLHRSLDKQNKFIILFMKLLVGNIHYHPLKRLSIGETTNKLEAIIDTIEANVWIDLYKSLFTATASVASA